MKNGAIALFLLAMVFFSGCGAKELFTEWEEDWVAFEQTSLQATAG